MSTAKSTAALAPLQARWKALAPREQNLVLAAGALLATALLWWLMLAPALQTLRAAPARHAALDAQLQRLQALQAEAQQLRDAPPVRAADARRSLQNTLAQQLGDTAQIQFTGDRATVTLKGASASVLAQWLAQARSNAHAAPLEARLAQSADAARAAPAGEPRWNGTLVLSLPTAADQPSDKGRAP